MHIFRTNVFSLNHRKYLRFWFQSEVVGSMVGVRFMSTTRKSRISGSVLWSDPFNVAANIRTHSHTYLTNTHTPLIFICILFLQLKQKKMYEEIFWSLILKPGLGWFDAALSHFHCFIIRVMLGIHGERKVSPPRCFSRSYKQKEIFSRDWIACNCRWALNNKTTFP